MFKKHDEVSESNQDQLIIDKRQASWLVAGLFFIGCLLFVVGYLIGKQHAMHEFAHSVVNDSFVDQAQYSVYSLYGQTQLSEPEDEKSTEGDAVVALTEQVGEISSHDVTPIESTESGTLNRVYYAQLIGFKSKRTADEFMKRVTELGIPVVLHKHISKGPKGTAVTWYQAVTGDYTNEAELNKIVSLIKRVEKIKDVQIKSRKQ